MGATDPIRMGKENIAKQTNTTFECQIGSNAVIVDGKKKYLDIIVWDNKVTYEDIKEHIVD